MLVIAGALVAANPAGAGSLSEATSPYLRAHAEDAIAWRPWSREALDRARREDKLVFLSIGYASCHWCHVMARTTFADPRVVDILNRHFVPILVDREERPDLDHHFMPVMAAMLGRSGSPANFFLTADAVPLYAMGYLAPGPQYGEPGFLPIVRDLVAAWTKDPQDILKQAGEIRAELEDRAETRAGATSGGTTDPRAVAARAWSASLDRRFGGFARQPKFPFPNVHGFLLRHGVWRGDRKLVAAVLQSLDRMAGGGLRDHLGGAFHRYAVDQLWQVPHFEIMLADNALLARLYLDAYLASGRPRHAAVARGVLDDLLRRLRLPDGTFAAGLDADSDGEEGRFYTWTEAEVRAVLGPAAAGFIAAYLDQVHGLVAGRAVLRQREQPDFPLHRQQGLADARAKLLAARAERHPPKRDDLVLTSWNGLVISAFARAARILGDDGYLQVANQAMARLAMAEGDLPHGHLDGRPGVGVFLDDYAFLAAASLDLYEADFDVRHLDRARRLMSTLIRRFQATPGTPFRFAPIGGGGTLPNRAVLDEDGIPSGNAAALAALYRLALYGAGTAFEAQARLLTLGVGQYLGRSAAAASGLLAALDYRPSEAHEIVIVGNREDAATRRLLREVDKRLLHGTVLALIPPDAAERNPDWPLLAARPMIDGTATAYVCKKRLCELPTNLPAELAGQLDRLVKSRP
jgi:hypothetical protein